MNTVTPRALRYEPSHVRASEPAVTRAVIRGSSRNAYRRRSVGQFENRGQTDLSTRRTNRALGQIRLSPVFKLAHASCLLGNCVIVDFSSPDVRTDPSARQNSGHRRVPFIRST